MNQEQKTLSVNADYSDLLEFAGLTVLHGEIFGQYQGDYLFAVKRAKDNQTEEFGIVIVGYGSCSACDALESLRPSFGNTWATSDYAAVTNLAHGLADNVHWGTYDQLMGKLFTEDSSFLQWYRSEPNYGAKLFRVLQELPPGENPCAQVNDQMKSQDSARATER